MKKRSRILTICLCALCALAAPYSPAQAAEAPEVSAQSAILISGDDGSVLFEKNAHERLAMASTTKIMTALLTLEEAARSGDQALNVTEEMVRVEGSSMGLQAGDRLTLSNLTAGMLLASGNDAANAAALFLGGSQEGFAEQMNARAAQIGMEESHFVTPSGLDDEAHYSTAYDMALLAREAMGNEAFADIAASAVRQVEFLEPARKVSYSNHNKLLRLYEGCIGVKTGFTKKAGRCLVSAARREGTTLIAVTLNAPDDWNDHMALFDYGFSQVRTVGLTGGVLPDFLPVVGGTADAAALRPGEGIVLTLPLAQAQGITQELYLPAFLYAPVEAGQKVGEARYLSGGELIYSLPVYTVGGVPAPEPEPGFWESLWNRVSQWLAGAGSGQPK